MNDIAHDAVLGALAEVVDPESGRNVVEAGMIQGLSVEGGHIRFALEVAYERGARAEPLRAACVTAVGAVPGVEKVSAVLTAHRNETVPQSPHAHNHQHEHRQPVGIAGVGTIVAVASGKGGVGKSTVAVNLAVALAGLGLKTGVLDADIYGPSIPKLMGLTEELKEENGQVLPIAKFGIKAMSIGLMIDEDTPMIWRGPMVQNAILQMLRQVAWAPLDVLVIDLPPGTGDAQLAIVQSVPLKGAIIVSTPQDLALLDARKAMNMFRTTHVPILGLIENMSGFSCPHCGHISPIFGQGGAKATAERLRIPFLGDVPLVPLIRESSDAGAPVAAVRPDGPEAASFHLIAKEVAAKIATASPQTPKIVFE